MLKLLKRLFGGNRGRRKTLQRPAARTGAGPAARSGLPSTMPAGVDLLDNPELSLDAPQDPGFDPYNTGTFDRSGSWERINKRRNG